jgi:phage gpG-like protein
MTGEYNLAVIQFDTKELRDFLSTLGARIEKNFDSKKALKESADFIADVIRKRTLSGRDVDLKPFAKSKAGGSEKVTLADTGKMLNSIESKVISDTEAVVGIFDPIQQKKAIVHQLGLGKTPQRRFFGISEQDAGSIDQIVSIFAKHINSAITKTT